MGEGQSRLGIQCLDLGHHIGEVLIVDTADALQHGGLAAGETVQILDQGLHGRIEAVAVVQLEGEAFAEVAGENTRRIAILGAHQDRLDLGLGNAQPFGDLLEFGPQVAGLVEAVDEEAGDHALAGIGENHVDLVRQVFAQGLFPGKPLFDVERFPLEAAAGPPIGELGGRGVA